MLTRCVGEIIGARSLARTTPETTVDEACHVLERLDVGALVVMDDGDTLLGVVSERDIVRKCICRARSTAETRVDEIMVRHPTTIAPTASPADALAVMIASGFRHLPVVEHGRVRGLLSLRDVPTEYRTMFDRYAEALLGKVGMIAPS
jgi:CBS domain-containing protein